eukprot:CAMPEP_0196818336 /NCGR_PEP_ID=MMETSP1362-20130617/65097_1 /TAXON_ID=163516 /ORGANISM="Leptocylindrus danicus, Strain CCMP1856" /LENGTH=513 /DNA_ID=CAMNT_0042196399 /DNA_START=150 /DNA_END=1691 /DNA_ORIENTATION=-
MTDEQNYDMKSSSSNNNSIMKKTNNAKKKKKKCINNRHYRRQRRCSSTRTLSISGLAVLFLHAQLHTASGNINFPVPSVPNPLQLLFENTNCLINKVGSECVQYCNNIRRSSGIYYGIRGDLLDEHISCVSNSRTRSMDVASNPSMQLADTMDDLRRSLDELREELRQMREFQRQVLGADVDGTGDLLRDNPAVKAKRRREQFDKVAKTVEVWAERLLFEEGEEEGWVYTPCNKIFKNKFNPSNTIQCFMKWLPDPRGEDADPNDGGTPYPCIKVYATIDASYDKVCHFLADEENLPVYNDLVIQNRDLEDIDSHSKICWGRSPQILFIKPREFVTFCHHRWKRDGTQIVVNQAVDHHSLPPVTKEQNGKVCRAYALRGANFIWRDPNDPSKTKFALLAHANPGGGLPEWAMKSAINALAPIEPYKLFHKIEKGAQKQQVPPPTTFTSSGSGKSGRPGGLSQLGYACFWPQGGGLEDQQLKEENIMQNDNEDIVGEHDDHGGGQNMAPVPYSE